MRLIFKITKNNKINSGKFWKYKLKIMIKNWNDLYIKKTKKLGIKYIENE